MSDRHPTRVYISTSWRDAHQLSVVRTLQDAGHDVYDAHVNEFDWESIDPKWQDWTPAQYRDALAHPIVQSRVNSSALRIQWVDAFLLVQPAGRGAHLELGLAIGVRVPTCVLLYYDEEGDEPEMLVRAADKLALSTDEVLDWILSL